MDHVLARYKIQFREHNNLVLNPSNNKSIITQQNYTKLWRKENVKIRRDLKE